MNHRRVVLDNSLRCACNVRRAASPIFGGGQSRRTTFFAELTGGWHPSQRACKSIQSIVELTRVYTQLAEIISQHHFIVQLIDDLAGGPDTKR